MITKAQLHSLPKFVDLFNDPRFVSAIVHLRENFPNKREGSGDEWRGWMGALDALDALREPPKGDPGKITAPAPYTKAEPQPVKS